MHARISIILQFSFGSEEGGVVAWLLPIPSDSFAFSYTSDVPVLVRVSELSVIYMIIMSTWVSAASFFFLSHSGLAYCAISG